MTRPPATGTGEFFCEVSAIGGGVLGADFERSIAAVIAEISELENTWRSFHTLMRRSVLAFVTRSRLP